jgi:hypothetical protein
VFLPLLNPVGFVFIEHLPKEITTARQQRQWNELPQKPTQTEKSAVPETSAVGAITAMPHS